MGVPMTILRRLAMTSWRIW